MSALDEAASWLASAEFLLEQEERGRSRYTVVVAQCVHALIRANDALAWRFLRRRARRHDEAPRPFGDLVRTNKIPSKDAPSGTSSSGPCRRSRSTTTRGRRRAAGGEEVGSGCGTVPRGVRDILPLSER